MTFIYRKITQYFLKSRDEHRFIFSLIIAIMVTLVYILVYTTGGSQYVYIHTLYIPIILAAIVFGSKAAIAVAITGGVITGYFMPLDTQTMAMQPWFNWIFRTFMFVLIGAFVGYVFEVLKQKHAKTKEALIKHPETQLPSYRAYFDKEKDNEPVENCIMMTMYIQNFEEILVLLGRDVYLNIIKASYEDLKRLLKNATVIQVDNYKFWIEVDIASFDAKFDEILEYFEEKIYTTQKLPVYVDVVIGFSRFEQRREKRLEAFRQSELAALHAKENKLRYAAYDVNQALSKIDLELLSALPHAIQEEQLFLEYHPIVDMKTNQPVAFETLVRWRHSDRVIGPLDFIAMAEETKLIDLITEWIVKQVIKDYSTLTSGHNIMVNINLSQRNLNNPTLINRIIQYVKKENYEDKAIGVELTESTLMLDLAMTQKLLQTLRDNNIPTSIDDFGTGYSTLASLNTLPLDRIKIDREMVFVIEQEPSTAKLVKMIIDYAHSLGLEVIAEGIESKEALQLLKDFGCDYGQGFYYAKPMPLDQAKQWLINNIDIKKIGRNNG